MAYRCTRLVQNAEFSQKPTLTPLSKAGSAAEEVVASLFEAVVHQNLATLTKGNTPMPEVLLLGGPNLFFKGLQQAWRRNLAALWADRRIV